MIRSRPSLLCAALDASLAIAPVAPGASAAAVEENEALVMRIVFDDCLGYIRSGRTPFKGLHTGPASPTAMETVHPMMRTHGIVREVLSARYVASWGEAPDSRFCAVFTAYGTPEPGRLGVRPQGFLTRVNARAAQTGLTDGDPNSDFSPLNATRWSEPVTEGASGPKRPISVSIIPTDANADESLLDAGLIIMGGPTLGKP